MHEPIIANEDARTVVWAVLAQFWVDTSYDAEELDAFADRIASCGLSVRELDRIVHWDVCGGFSSLSLRIGASVGMCLPDWYYPEELAIQQIRAWKARPKRDSLLNPKWIAGYIAARRYISDSWADLRGRIIRRMEGRAV